jgi:branched-chain amino acid transport system substrate-binding protein
MIKRRLAGVLVFTFFFTLVITSGWAENIKLGGIYPLSGPSASTGQLIKQGVLLAQDIVNNQYSDIDLEIAKWEGIPSMGNAKIEVVIGDHRGDPALGADTAARLIEDEKVKGLFGCWHSSVTKTVSTVGERNKIVTLTASSSSSSLSKRGYKYFYRAIPHIGIYGRNPFELLEAMKGGKVKGVSAEDAKKIKKIMLINENTEWGKNVNDNITKFSKEYGYELKTLTYSAKSMDLSSEVNRARAYKPDVVILASYVSDAILFTKTFKEQRFAPSIVIGFEGGFTEPGYPNALGKDSDFVSLVEYFPLKSLVKTKPFLAKLNEMFKKRSGGESLSTGPVLGFIATQLWAEVLNKAGSTDSDKIIQALNVIEIPGTQLMMPWRAVQFENFGEDKNQNRRGNNILVQFKNKEKHVLWPTDLQTEPMVYPFPKWSDR